jgi:hypothetical protein
MTKEEVSYRLADTFMKEYKQFDSYLFSMRTVDKSKWWIHFQKAAGYRSIKGWNPEVHVKSCFEKYGKILPFRLFGKTALAAWEEYHHRYEGKQTNDFIIQMLDTYKRIKKWSDNDSYDPEYYKNNIMNIKRGNLSIHFLSLSKSFRRLNEVENFFYEEDLNFKRAVVFRNKKIVSKMKEIFGKDFK